MDDIDKFLKKRQRKLLKHLDRVKASGEADWQAFEFVNRVLDEWSYFAGRRKLREPDWKERTFWYALYQLEEIAEFPPQSPLDPFQVMLLQNLGRITEVLREGGELPAEFFATRPGEELAIDTF